MALKNYFIIAVLALLLQNCQNSANSATTSAGEKDELMSVEWSTYGGQRGYVENLTVTKDSIKHKTYTTMNDRETVEHRYKNSPEQWQKLVGTFQISDFKKVKDGESKLLFDGTDQKITVRTTTEADSLVNGFEDAANYPKIEKFAKLLESIRPEKK